VKRPVEIQRASPIFILGIMPRSGTNFLMDLLCLHPSCARPRLPISEDLFLEASDHLVAYTRAVRDSWDPRWGTFDGGLMQDFHRSLGDGLISFLWADRSRRLVTKSPSVKHVGRFFAFFPRARLIILVRDGRSVVQSAMETFGWDFEWATRLWAAAAAEIRRFQAHARWRRGRYRIIRYEDLVQDRKATLLPVLRFLELDVSGFDFDAAVRLPVRGSSFYFGPERSSVHWEPVERGPDFEPTERWRSWSPDMHERFEWIAGRELRYFGYRSLMPPIEGAGRTLRHRILDRRWQAWWGMRTVVSRVRVKLMKVPLPLRRHPLRRAGGAREHGEGGPQ
jgi:hypothetical protein